MKAPILITLTLLLSANVFAQPPKSPPPGSPPPQQPPPKSPPPKSPAPYPDGWQPFKTYARALPRLYDRKDFDSIGLYAHRLDYPYSIDGRADADIFCLRILLGIQQSNLSTAYLANRYFFIQLNEYARVIIPVLNDSPYIRYHSGKYFDATSYDKDIFRTTARWAGDLLRERTLDSTESFLCRVFAGDIPHPCGSIQAGSATYRELDSLLTTSILSHRNSHIMNGAIGIGSWAPRGHLAVIGAHPELYVEIGRRTRLDQVNLTVAYRFNDASQPYLILRHGVLLPQTHYDGYYVGLEYNRYLVHTLHFELGTITGLGWDAFDISMDANETSNPLYPLVLRSLNGNAGLRLKGYFSGRGYFGLIGKYNFMHYYNKGGTPLDGNALSIDFIVGMN